MPFGLTRAVLRLGIAVVIGVLVTVVTGRFSHLHNTPWFVRAVVGWDAAAVTLCVLTWVVILRSNPQRTRRRAAGEDPGRSVVFALAVGASLFSLFAAAVVLRDVKNLPGGRGLWTALSLAAVVLSWLVTQTAFTMRYAHLYYRNPTRRSPGGLNFPDDDQQRLPDDLDFAYYAFTLGMCFQVSDVTIGCPRIRRTTLGHAVLSFIYNTAILALAMNQAFNMLTPG